MALAERFELLLSIYAKGERPTGSSDPYALRRAGNGILQILWEQGWSLNLQTLLERATSHWAGLLPAFKVDSSASRPSRASCCVNGCRACWRRPTDADLVWLPPVTVAFGVFWLIRPMPVSGLRCFKPSALPVTWRPYRPW